MKPARIRLRIDELVLEGFEGGTRAFGAAVQAAVEAELGRLLAEGALEGWTPGPGRDLVDGGQFEAARGARPEMVGRQVARAVYGGLR